MQVSKSGTLTEQYAIHLGLTPNNSHFYSTNNTESSNKREISMTKGETLAENPLVTLQRAQVSSGIEGRCSDNVLQLERSEQSAQYGNDTLPFTFIELKNIDAAKLSTVKVLSTRSPDLRNIRNESSPKGPKVQIAKASEVDTSLMSTIDRTIIRLRQWKARILAEPPPVVTISVPDEPTTNSTEETKPKLASQFEFANRLEYGRNVTNHEIDQYAERRRQGHYRKKEFEAVPRVLLQNKAGE